MMMMRVPLESRKYLVDPFILLTITFELFFIITKVLIILNSIFFFFFRKGLPVQKTLFS